jgi:hypothetical protein
MHIGTKLDPLSDPKISGRRIEGLAISGRVLRNLFLLSTSL